MLTATIISLLLSLGIIQNPGQAASVPQETINSVIVNVDTSEF